MHILRRVPIVVLLTMLLSLSACAIDPMSRQQAVDWYTSNASELKWVGYQGSDKDYHYFVGRKPDTWVFIRIWKNDLTVEDERPFTSTYRYPLYYYLVDPTQDYIKIPNSEPKLSDD